MGLQIENLTWGVAEQNIIDSISLHIANGELIGIVGPNGSGKSSILRCIYRVNRPRAGIISLDNDDVWKLTTRQMAKRSAAVIQEATDQFDFKVKEIVLMGRNPHKGMLERDNEKDEALVNESLDRVGMGDLKDRFFSTLSGGEKQRTFIARALAQQAQFLILDEPTNHLDIHYQLEIMELVKNIGVTCLMVMHDLNLAAAYCDRIYVMKDGQVYTSGTPDQVLNSELIREVYRVHSNVSIQPETGKLHISFYHMDDSGN